MGILGLGRKKKDVVEDVAPEPEVVEEPTGPELCLITPEVAGGTSFHLMRFQRVEAAIEYLGTQIPAQIPRIHAFWALLEKPDDISADGEAMVLIRSASSANLVYVVSFVDIESALSFARFEVKRGLALGSLIIWWTAPVTINNTEDGIQLTPAEPPAITPGWMASATSTRQLSPPLEKARLRQEQEKSRLQAELEEIRQRQAQTEELHRRQAQIDDKRKQLAMAEKARRQTKAEEQRRLQAEAKEIEKLRAEAEELRERQAEAEDHERREAHTRRLQAKQDKEARLQAAAEEEKRLQDELEEIERQQAMAEERERQGAVEREQRAEAEEERRRAEAEEMMRLQAEAEELAQQLAEELRLLAAEEKGRRHAEREAKPRLQAEAEQTRLLQEELGEIKSQQIEAEQRWRQETEERRLRAEAEEEQRREEVSQKRRLEAEEEKRIEAELAELKRLQAETTERSLRTEEDENRRQAEEERAGRLQVGLQQIKRQQFEAQERWRQESEERRQRAEAEERQRREAEDDKRRLEAEETRIIQAKLEEIRLRLAEAQAVQADASVVGPAPAETSEAPPPPDHQGGMKTHWVRRTTPPEEEEASIAAAAESAASEAPPTEPVPDGMTEPTRDFSAPPEIEPAAAGDSRPLEVAPAPDEPVQAEAKIEETATGQSSPLWDVDTDGVAAEPADVVELRGQDSLPNTAETEDARGEAEKFRPEDAEDVASTASSPVERPDFANADPALKTTAESSPMEDQQSEEFSFGGEEPLVAEAPSFLREDGKGGEEAEGVFEPISPQTPYESAAAGGGAEPQLTPSPEQDGDITVELYPIDLESEEVQSAEDAGSPEEDEPVFSLNPKTLESTGDTAVENSVAVGVNGHAGLQDDVDEAEPPETIPGEEHLSPDMAAFLRSRRRDKKERPFDGFNSPPGRF